MMINTGIIWEIVFYLGFLFYIFKYTVWGTDYKLEAPSVTLHLAGYRARNLHFYKLDQVGSMGQDIVP